MGKFQYDHEKNNIYTVWFHKSTKHVKEPDATENNVSSTLCHSEALSKTTFITFDLSKYSKKHESDLIEWTYTNYSECFSLFF